MAARSDDGHERDSGGEFSRDMRYITTRITADGRDGYPVEAGRYRLAVSRACPWANRAIIVRRLLGLEDALSMAVAGPTHDQRSWTFDLDPGGRDPILGIERLQEAYFARFPGYGRGLAVQTKRTPETRERVRFANNMIAYAADREVDAALITEYLEKVHLGFRPADSEVQARWR